MLPFEEAAAAEIAAAFEEPLTYTGAGLINGPIVGIESRGAKPSGSFSTLSKMFCIRADQLPGQTANGDTIGQGGLRWRVIEQVFDSAVGEHQLFVEKAPPA